MRQAYIDTSIALLVAKIGYWQFVKLSETWQLVIPTVTMRELCHISQNTRRILHQLIARKLICIECSADTETFDSFALATLRQRGAAIISLDKHLIRKYYRGVSPPIVLCRNRFHMRDS